MKSFFSETDPIKAALGTNFNSTYYEDKRLSRFDIIEDSIVAIRKLLGMNNFADATKYTGDVDYAGFNNAESVNYGKIGGASFDPNNSGKSGIFNLIYNNPVTTELKAKQATMEEIIPLQIEDTITYARVGGINLNLFKQNSGTFAETSFTSLVAATNTGNYLIYACADGKYYQVNSGFTYGATYTINSKKYRTVTINSYWSGTAFDGIKINLVPYYSTVAEAIADLGITITT